MALDLGCKARATVNARSDVTKVSVTKELEKNKIRLQSFDINQSRNSGQCSVEWFGYFLYIACRDNIL